MKTSMFAALLFASAQTLGTAAAQPAPFNQAGVTMGHWHLASKDLEANKKLFLAMGGKLTMPGGAPLIMFPGLYINLALGNASNWTTRASCFSPAGVAGSLSSLPATSPAVSGPPWNSRASASDCRNSGPFSAKGRRKVAP